MSKDFTIVWNGQPATITVNDHPTFGIVSKCVENAVNMQTPTGLPEIKYREYAIGLACNLIEKAPWGPTSPDIINNMDFETAAQIIGILGDLLPLERFLSVGGKLTYGKKFNVPQSLSTTESTTPSPNGE